MSRRRSLSRDGTRAEELDEVDVEERRTHLQRARHARSIDLHEDVVLEVRLRIEVDQPLDRIAGRRGVEDALRWSARAVDGGATSSAACSSGDEDAEPRRMSRGRRLGSAPQEALELEVEAEVRRRHRQAIGERDTTVRSWSTRGNGIDPRNTVGREGRIPGKELVAAVAAERDRDVLARESRKQVRGENRGVGEWLVDEVGDRRATGRASRQA